MHLWCGRTLRTDVEQLRQELGTRHAVNDCVMDLGKQADPSPTEAFNEVHLPRRLLRLERPTHQFGREIT